MNHPDSQKSAIELIYVLITAINNIRLYPPTSELIHQSVKRIENLLRLIFAHAESIEFGESKKTLLVQGDPVPEKLRIKLPVIAFAELMRQLGIRSILLKKDMPRTEIAALIQVMGMPAEDIRVAGGIRALCWNRGISHVDINEKTYVELESDQRLVPESDLTDDQIAARIINNPVIPADLFKQTRALAGDPERMFSIFQAGVRQMCAMMDADRPEEAEAVLLNLTNGLKRFAEDKGVTVFEWIIPFLARMDDPSLCALLSANLGQVFGDEVYRHLILGGDSESFAHLIRRIREIANRGDASGIEIGSSRQVLNLMKNARKAFAYASSGLTRPEHKAGARKRGQAFKETLGRLYARQTAASPELIMLDNMTDTLLNLLSQEKYSTLVSLMDRLRHLLSNKDFAVRMAAVELLCKVDEQLSSAGRVDERVVLSGPLTEWLHHEHQISPLAETVMERVLHLAQELIRQEREREAAPVLASLDKLTAGTGPDKTDLERLADNLLYKAAEGDILDFLITDICADGTRKPPDEILCLVILGRRNVNRLLDRLQDSNSRSERNRIITALTRIGASAAPMILERMKAGGAWYYRRNLILMLGRIGGSPHISVLTPCLKDQNTRIQREAIFAMQNIGGADAAQALFENFHQVGEENQVQMVSVLTSLQYRQAAGEWIRILENRAPGISKKSKTDLMVRLCEALGQLEEEAAVPVLEKISQAKSFLTGRGYDTEIRSAAQSALMRIGKN